MTERALPSNRTSEFDPADYPWAFPYIAATRRAAMTTETLFRPRAFIPRGDDEGPFDYLGFWHYGTFRGEWSGTSSWLADMPLPEDVIVEKMVKDMTRMPEVVSDARTAVSEGRIAPVLFLAPIETRGRYVVLPVQGHPYDANPNFIAHIERGIPGGEWFVTTEPIAKMKDAPHHAVLVYVVAGEARALVAPLKQETPDA